MVRKRIVQVVFGLLMVLMGIGQMARGLRECGILHGEMRVVSAATSRGFAGLQAVGPTTTFAPTDTPIHFVVGVGDAVEGTPIAAAWYVVDVPSEAPRQIFLEPGTLPAGDATMDFTLTDSTAWPIGDYRVDLLLAGQVVRSVAYSVR